MTPLRRPTPRSPGIGSGTGGVGRLVLTLTLCGWLKLQGEVLPTAVALPVTQQEFTLKMPRTATYRVESPLMIGLQAIRAESISGAGAGAGAGRELWFGPRLVLSVEPGTDWQSLVAGRPIAWLREVAPGMHLFDAGEAIVALREAAALAERPEVRESRPVLWQSPALHRPLAAPRNDPKFGALWHLENRWPDGGRRGPDLNARAAWNHTRGQGVVVAVADDGVDLGHPEFTRAAEVPHHYSFTSGTTNGTPSSAADYHATLVAGFIAARDNNRVGIAGMAPRASLASWKIFNGSLMPPLFDDELMEMFRYRTQDVWVQNHSWGNAEAEPLAVTSVEQVGIDSALNSGRGGLGVVMVRSAGNGRRDLQNANDDGYANDPRVIAVGAVDSSGRVAEYSNAGACLLVSGFGGGNDRELTSTDRVGGAGQNTRTDGTDAGDYWTSTSLSGTSFSAPQISGLVALLLAANPALSVRDVQQILILAARHWDLQDPDLVQNGGGFRHAHNVGFGVPDAGVAVDLARAWRPRPALVEQRLASTEQRSIVDDGMWVVLEGNGVTPALRSVPSTPSLGLLVDLGTEELPLVDVGYATNELAIDLTGRAALVLRGPPGDFPDDRNTFARKLERVADAGAEYAVVCNDRDGVVRLTMAQTGFTRIPAVMVNQIDGEAIRNQLASEPTTTVRWSWQSATYEFGVDRPLACEHVGVRLSSTHQRRGDLQVTLRSPVGTVSILQRLCLDIVPSPAEWTYWSTRHFGESAQGTWTVAVTDGDGGMSGMVTGVELIIRGVELLDSDADGLDDEWEQQWLGGLEQGARLDPDGDGYTNGQEQLMGTDPTSAPMLDLWSSLVEGGGVLLTWNARPGATYVITAAETLSSAYTVLQTIEADVPSMEWVVPSSATERYFRVMGD